MSFTDHLKKQLGFIERSCRAYDIGHTDEAIRIATAIRVLIHNTKTSTSLLKHLGATTIRLLSTTRAASPTSFFYMGLGVMSAKSTGESITAKFAPLLDGPIQDLIPVSQWWSQIVFVLNPRTRLSRRDIVLAAANKDGGAHVDSNLTPEYEALARNGVAGALVYSRDSRITEEPFVDAHLVAIRQMGHELLHSHELLARQNAA